MLTVALLVVLGAAAARVNVWPPSAEPVSADVVVALAGDRGQRLNAALELMERGVAPVLVISTGTRDRQRWADRLCADGSDAFSVLCFDPDPVRTIGEAQAVGALAAERGWQSIVVVTSTFHIARAGVLIRQCVDGEVAMVDAGNDRAGFRLVWLILREWPGLVAAHTFDRAC